MVVASLPVPYALSMVIVNFTGEAILLSLSSILDPITNTDSLAVSELLSIPLPNGFARAVRIF